MNRAAALFFAILLAACGGGGGGGMREPGPGSDAIFPLSNIDVPGLVEMESPESFETPEFRANPGLGLINAQYAYALGGTGAGVTVAVIDSGFDFDHPELAAAIADNTINIAAEGEPVDENDLHGTGVAGVIAARKGNGAGRTEDVHGVAFRSSILAIRNNAFSCDSDPMDEENVICERVGDSEFEDIIADGIRYAVDNGAKIINLSLAGLKSEELGNPDTPGGRLRAAMVAAVEGGVILVVSTGNNGEPYPAVPANFADITPDAGGLALAVGAAWHDGRGRVTRWNGCGATPYCLLAPGTLIETAAADGYEFGETVRLGGTSFAAPHVAGAAALLMQMFPSLTPREIVSLLLLSADKTAPYNNDEAARPCEGGTPELKPECDGAGLLDLRAAVMPRGESVIEMASGATARLDESRFVAGAAFGTGLNPPDADAVFVDGYGRVYPLDIGRLIAPMRRDFGLQNALAVGGGGGEYRWFALPAANLSLRLGAAETAAAADMPGAAVDSKPADVRLNFALHLADDAAFDFAANSPPPIAPPPLCRGCGFLTDAFSPIFALAPADGGFALRGDFGAATEFAFGGGGGDDGWIAAVRIVHRIAGGASAAASVVSATFGALYEDEKILGGYGEGAFQSDGAHTRFVELSAQTPLADSLRAFAAATFAAAEARDAGLLSDWGRITADAYAAGIQADAYGGRIAALLARPLRVKNADVRLTAPVGRDESGLVQTRAVRFNAAPAGREILFQLSYLRELRRDAAIQTWAAARAAPGHDKNAAPDFAVGARLDWEF